MTNKAISEYNQAIKSQPNFAAAYYNRGSLISDWAKVLKHRPISIKRNNSAILGPDSLGAWTSALGATIAP
jgi:hypothetical protein